MTIHYPTQKRSDLHRSPTWQKHMHGQKKERGIGRLMGDIPIWLSVTHSSSELVLRSWVSRYPGGGELDLRMWRKA